MEAWFPYLYGIVGRNTHVIINPSVASDDITMGLYTNRR